MVWWCTPAAGKLLPWKVNAKVLIIMALTDVSTSAEIRLVANYRSAEVGGHWGVEFCLIPEIKASQL